MAKVKTCMDIGYRNIDDAIWLIRNGSLEVISRVTFSDQEPWTHCRLWGGKVMGSWHGRYDVGSGFCSIVPPEKLQYRRPTKAVLDLLTARFSVFRFYYFSGGVESFSPNPAKRSGP